MIITTTYEGPDLDGYSSAVAYAELLRLQGKEAQPYVVGEPQIEVQWLLEEFDIKPEFASIESLVGSQVVLLDASSLKDIPEPLKVEQIIEIIDHRKIHEAEKFTNAKSQIDLIGAAATIVAERFQEAGLEPSRQSAFLLYGGIISNTQNLTSAATTNRDREAFKWLKEISKAPEDLVRNMFVAKSDLSGGRLEKALISDSKIPAIAGKIVGTMQLEIIDAEKLVNSRAEDIKQTMTIFAQENSVDFMFTNIKDLISGESFLFCIDQRTRELLSKIGDITWENFVGRSIHVVNRKWILSHIDEILSKA